MDTLVTDLVLLQRKPKKTRIVIFIHISYHVNRDVGTVGEEITTLDQDRGRPLDFWGSRHLYPSSPCVGSTPLSSTLSVSVVRRVVLLSPPYVKGEWTYVIHELCLDTKLFELLRIGWHLVCVFTMYSTYIWLQSIFERFWRCGLSVKYSLGCRYIYLVRWIIHLHGTYKWHGVLRCPPNVGSVPWFACISFTNG